MDRSRRPPKAKPPKGEERKNQLDLFFDWAVEAAKRAAAATAAAAQAAAKHFEELKVSVDRRSAKFCGMLIALLVACSYKSSTSLTTLIVAVATVLSALLTAVPLVVSHTPRLADRALRASNYVASFLLIVGVTSFVAEMMMPSLWSSQQVIIPKIELPPVSSAPDEKSLTEEAQREAAAQAEKEAARVADCHLKENSTQGARQTYSRREKDFARCRTEYESAITLKSLDAYCGKERGRLDAAGRALDAAVANLCSSTGGTKKSR